jgi:hypothetical protein
MLSIIDEIFSIIISFFSAQFRRNYFHLKNFNNKCLISSNIIHRILIVIQLFVSFRKNIQSHMRFDLSILLLGVHFNDYSELLLKLKIELISNFSFFSRYNICILCEYVFIFHFSCILIILSEIIDYFITVSAFSDIIFQCLFKKTSFQFSLHYKHWYSSTNTEDDHYKIWADVS